MFKKVLIAEDHQSIKFSIEQTLINLGISESQYVYYCDDALSRLKRNNQENNPFDLLITDLSFVDDGREQEITTGSQLIKEAKSLQPNLKVLVFSAESNPAVIRDLFERFNVNGYVCKGRHDAIDLNNAISIIAEDNRYIPLEFRKAVRDKNTYDFDDFDTMIISQLALGVKLKDIPTYLEKRGAKASSLSSVEKRLNLIKESFSFTTNAQLIAYCKDRKII